MAVVPFSCAELVEVLVTFLGMQKSNKNKGGAANTHDESITKNQKLTHNTDELDYIAHSELKN